MKKVFLFITLLILSVFFMWRANRHTSSELEKVTNGDTTGYFLNGKLTYATDLQYAMVQKTENGNQVIEQYYDEHGKPARQSAGHYALLRVYEDSHETLRTYLGKDLQPVTSTYGYSSRVRIFQDDHVAQEWYEDVNGSPTPDKTGVYGRRNEWKVNRNTVITYVDENGQPLNNKSGYAVIRKSYYEETPWKGKVKDEFYYDASGNPVSNSKVHCGIHYEYDEEGRTIRIDYLNADETLLSTVVRTYYPDNTLETEKYYDSQGLPQKQKTGNYGIRKVNGKTVYLDVNGKEYLDLNRLLHNEPLIVIVFGVIVLAVSFLSSRQVNIILLALYTGFILYMTLWDRSGETRGRFELFWSYKQFFSSDSLRLEIMNNIWLFIPLGGILMRLGFGWKTVLVCVILSIGIEAAQYFTGRGLAEFDDVISNTLGGLIGAYFCEKVKKRGWAAAEGALCGE